METQIDNVTLRALNPLEAVRARLAGEFGMEDEPAMIEAIRKDSRIVLSDEQIIAVVCEAMDEELEPEACWERLVVSGNYDQQLTRASSRESWG